MNITIAVDIKDEVLTDQTFQNLMHMAGTADFVIITDKKRYELPKHELVKIDALQAKVKNALPTTDGIVFEIKGNELLHELALEYIKSFNENRGSLTQMPKHIRDIIVTSAESNKRQLSPSNKAAKPFKISCIVPIMNEAKHLQEAVDSVIAQTIGFENIQLILINCNPSGKRYTLCTEYANKYPENIVHIAQDFTDIHTARNYGVSIATGDYIAFLEQDGKYANDFMHICAEFLSNPKNAQFVTTKVEPITEPDARSPLLNYSFGRSATLLIRGNSHYVHTTVSNVMFARNLANGISFDSKYGIFSELEFIHRILLKVGKYAFQADSVYYKRDCGISRGLRLTDINELGFIKHLFAVSIANEGSITRYTKYLAFAILMYYQHLSYKPEQFAISTLHDILGELDEKIICYAFRGSSTSELLMRQFLMSLKGQLILLVKPTFELLSFSRQGEKICTNGRYTLPLGHNYNMLITTENGHVRNYRILNREYLRYMGFIVCEVVDFEFAIHYKEANPFSFYFTTASGIPEKIVCAPSYAEKGTPWMYTFGNKFAYGSEDSNTVSIEDLAVDPLKDIVQGIIKKSYYAAEYDHDIKIVNDYLRMLELYPSASYIIVSKTVADSAYSSIARDNPGAKILIVSDKGHENTIKYGSREHKLYSLLTQKAYVSDYTESGFAFPYDTTQYKEFNAVYCGLVHSAVIQTRDGDA